MNGGKRMIVADSNRKEYPAKDGQKRKGLAHKRKLGMCLHVFVGSLLLTETGRLFPSLMLSSEVGCQHLCRQRNEETEKKNSK